jgi:hypothetical protein
LKSKLRKPLWIALVALVAALALPALASAALPTVTVVARKPGAVTVTGADALAPGATTFAFSGTGKEVDLLLVRLKPGRTADELLAAGARQRDATKLQDKFGDFVASGAAAKGQRLSVDVDLTAADYVLIDVTKDKPKKVATFTVAGTPTGNALPAGDASVTLKDYRIKAHGTLPKHGAISVHDQGPSPHLLVAFPLHPGASVKAALKALRRGRERAFNRQLGGPPVGLIVLMSPGVTDVVHAKLRTGTWVLACFYADAKSRGMPHMMLGMETAVTVK